MYNSCVDRTLHVFLLFAWERTTMIQGTYGPATIDSGKNKGKPRNINIKTGISKENAGGLPIKNDVAVVAINQGDIPLNQFESRSEVEQFAGEHFDTFVVDAANSLLKQRVTIKLNALFKKVTLPAASWSSVIERAVNAIKPESLFEPTARGVTKLVANDVVSLANDESMSVEERLAAILALANK